MASHSSAASAASRKLEKKGFSPTPSKLIASVRPLDQIETEDTQKAWGPWVVGKEDRTTVTTVTYETSFQRRNLEMTMAETIRLAAARFGLLVDRELFPRL